MKKRKDKLLFIILVIVVTILLFSLFKITTWYIDGTKINNIILDMKQKIPRVEKSENEETENYCGTSCLNSTFLEVDINALQNQNEEAVGWIQIPETKIDYPFVQHNDNIYYLNHSFDKKKNEAGWIFLDRRNNINDLDQNTILYAHGRVDKTMFGSLNNALKKETALPKVVKLSTKDYNYLFEVFSLYKIKTTRDYLNINYQNAEEYEKFLQKIKNRSAHTFSVEVTKEDKIITLSTCYNIEEKTVLHAKLIKRQKRK